MVFFIAENIYLCPMPRDNDLQTKKRETIVSYFKEMDAIFEYGQKKYTTGYCLAKTADRFFLTTRSIERYVYNI